MILDAVHCVDSQNEPLAFPKHRHSICVLQMEVQDTVVEVLNVLRSQEKPIFLLLPVDGEAFSCSEHFVSLGHLLAENGQHPFVCFIIPPHRANVIALATTYGIQNASSVEDAIQAFGHFFLSNDVDHSRLVGIHRSMSQSDSVTKEHPKVKTSSPQMMSKARKPFWDSGRIVLLLVVSAILLPLMFLVPMHPTHPTTAIVPLGTLSFESSDQFNPTLTRGYNDIVNLSLHSISAPPKGFSYYAWLMPDPSNDSTVPLLLGTLHPGSINLTYTSPDHTNLLTFYSGVRITVQPGNSILETPDQDPKTWKWQGFIPNIPSPGDENHYSLLSHLRHLLAKDPTLQANQIPGGLDLWLTQNVSKVEEWASAAQGDWHGMQTSPGDTDQIHRQLLRILEYLDGEFYYERDVPTGSPWIVDPSAGKIGLLDRVQSQQPPAFLVHVDIHLTGLASSPGHTMQQQQLAVLIDKVITRMSMDLQQVRNDAAILVKMNMQQLRLPGNQAKLNEIANLTSEVKSGWFDIHTGEDIGGVLWITSRLQQLASVPIY